MPFFSGEKMTGGYGGADIISSCTIDVNKGDVFDSEKHEAITQIKASDKKMIGKIVDIVESGYVLGEKILRYPKVVVAN